MNILPKVSIQMPTFNQKQYIKEAIDSALAQTYENLQIIVSDDCSSDYDIFEYLSIYKDNPKVVINRNKVNLGRVGNYRNTLYHLVEGEWFINLDGDDSFEKLQFLIDAMHHINLNLEEYRIVCFEFNHQLNYIKKYIKWYKELDEETIIVNGKDYLIMQKYYHNFMHANTIFNVKAAKESDFYNLDILNADFFSATKIWTKGYVILSSKKIFNWNIHNNNATFTASLQNIEKERSAIIDFKKYAEIIFKRYELNQVVNTLKYLLYTRVFNIYRNKKKDSHFFKYLIFNFKLNKYFIKKIITEL